ncbi:MAG: serine/threonine protein kinase [Muribaculaceae bacterium]|nr:serine/threonine protein kinase [Muribaculaceae bacterium]
MSVIQISDRNDTNKRYTYKVDLSAKPLGAGGMGKVYRGECLDNENHTTRPVAVKFIFDNQPDGVIDRARREAGIRLRNDNLVEMINFVEVEQQVPHGTILRYHVVSELLQGVMLLDLLRGKTQDAEGNEVTYARELYNLYKSKPEEFALIVVRNVLNGLLALHNAGYIHRDLDPSNIMVTADRKIKIIDFGIAKRVDSLSHNDRQLTSVGQFMGKAAYAAPELISGDLDNQNQTTDLYAVGIILYVLIVGELPFTGTLADIMNKQLNEAIPVKNVPDKKIRKIITKATQKQQGKRYHSAASFIADIENVNQQPSGNPSNNQQYFRILIWVLAIIAGLLIGFLIASNL